jgi:hypothetical protein
VLSVISAVLRISFGVPAPELDAQTGSVHMANTINDGTAHIYRTHKNAINAHQEIAN